MFFFYNLDYLNFNMVLCFYRVFVYLKNFNLNVNLDYMDVRNNLSGKLNFFFVVIDINFVR